MDLRPLFGRGTSGARRCSSRSRAPALTNMPRPAPLLHQLLVDELLVGLQHGQRIDPALGRDVAHGRQRVAFLEHAVEDHGHDPVAELAVDRLAVVPLSIHHLFRLAPACAPRATATMNSASPKSPRYMAAPTLRNVVPVEGPLRRSSSHGSPGRVTELVLYITITPRRAQALFWFESARGFWVGARPRRAWGRGDRRRRFKRSGATVARARKEASSCRPASRAGSSCRRLHRRAQAVAVHQLVGVDSTTGRPGSWRRARRRCAWPRRTGRAVRLASTRRYSASGACEVVW